MSELVRGRLWLSAPSCHCGCGLGVASRGQPGRDPGNTEWLQLPTCVERCGGAVTWWQRWDEQGCQVFGEKICQTVEYLQPN